MFVFWGFGYVCFDLCLCSELFGFFVGGGVGWGVGWFLIVVMCWVFLYLSLNSFGCSFLFCFVRVWLVSAVSCL